MEAAALTFSSSTLQIDPLRLLSCTGHKKPTITINPRKRTMTFHQPTLFPHGHLQLQVMCGHLSRHVAHVVRAGEVIKSDDGNRARWILVGPTVVLACVLGTMCLTLPMSRPSPAYAWSLFVAQEVSPLEDFVNMRKRRSTIKLEQAHDVLAKATSTTPDLASLKEAARKLASSGKTDEAVQMLKKAYEYPVHDKAKGQETFNIGLVLVEMLIYQGKYAEAEERLNDLDKFLPSNGRPDIGDDLKLYKVIIQFMTKEKEVRQSWEDYESSRPPIAPVSYEQFKEQMKKLTR